MKLINKNIISLLTINLLILLSSSNTFGQIKYGITGEVGISSTLGTRYTLGFDIKHTKNIHSMNLSFIPSKKYKDDWGLGYQYARKLFKNTYLQGGLIFWRGEFYVSYIDRHLYLESCLSKHLLEENIGLYYIFLPKKIHPLSIIPTAKFSVIHRLSRELPEPCNFSKTPFFSPLIGLKFKYQIN